MLGIVSAFPTSWRTSVTVLRGGGRDAKGNPQPPTEIPVDGCLFADKTTAEQMGFSDVVDADAAIYRDPDAGFRFESTDRVRIPDGARGAGVWSVDGRVQEWPLGVVVPLRKA